MVMLCALVAAGCRKPVPLAFDMMIELSDVVYEIDDGVLKTELTVNNQSKATVNSIELVFNWSSPAEPGNHHTWNYFATFPDGIKHLESKRVHVEQNIAELRIPKVILLKIQNGQAVITLNNRLSVFGQEGDATTDNGEKGRFSVHTRSPAYARYAAAKTSSVNTNAAPFGQTKQTLVRIARQGRITVETLRLLSETNGVALRIRDDYNTPAIEVCEIYFEPGFDR